MAYDPALPYDNGYLADAPAELRELFRAIKEDRIVNAGLLSGYSVGNNSGSVPLNNGTLNVDLNADQLDGHGSEYFAAATHTHGNATQNAAGLMSVADKTKLDNIATGAEVNQNAFSNVTVGANTLQADDKTDTLTLVAGSGISLTGNTINDVVTIAGVNATTSAAGLMSAADKTKLDAIPTTYLPLSGGTLTGNLTLSASAPIIATDTNTKYLRLANLDYNGGASLYMYGAGHTSNPGQFSLNAYDGTTRKTLTGKPDGTLTWGDTDVIYTHPTTAGNKHIPSGGSSGQILRWSAAGTAVWGDDNNTTYSVATPSADGLMSKTDKTQLDKTVGVNMTSTAPYIAVSVNTKYLRLMNVDYAGGASLYLHGAERETDPGIFTLTAHNGTTSKKLIGKPDGTLTWNGTNVMYVHPTTAGNKHIPSGGSSGQILKYSAAGTAAWSSLSDANIFPKPTTASGVGQLYQCGTSTAKEFTLPSGGTWFYVMECFNPNSTSIGTKVGTAAGGAKVTALNTTDTRSHCWAIRIA